MGYCDVCLSAGSVTRYGFCEICGTEHVISTQAVPPAMLRKPEPDNTKIGVSVQAA